MKSLEQRYPHLLDPRAIVGPRGIGRLAHWGGTVVAATLNERAAKIAAMDIEEQPATVLIQGRHIPHSGGHARKDSPARRADRILATAENIRAQQYSGHVAIAAIVENGMELTTDQAHDFSRLSVMLVNQHPDTNASAAINSSARQVGANSGLLVPVAAGNRFATNQALRAASMHVGHGAVGVYGPLVQDHNPSKQAYSLLGGDSEYYQHEADPDSMPSFNANGYMSDAGAAIDARLLAQYDLDEAYGSGGGVRNWAANWQRYPGDVWYEPALAVHDSRATYLGTQMLIEEAALLEPTTYEPPR